MSKARKRTKILGLWWNESREKVLELLSRAGDRDRYIFGKFDTCPLCKDAKVLDRFCSCIKCILPGRGDRRCLKLHKIMKRSTISKHLKEFTIYLFEDVLDLTENKNFEINNSIEKLISFIKEEQDENSSKS